MSKHIGIVACSAERAALCYRTVCTEGADATHAHPEVSMHTPPLSNYVSCLERGDWAGVGELMLTSAQKLAAIGAEILVCPDNTIHQALSFVLPRSPRPWLHIADVVAKEAQRRGFRRLGIVGTKWLVDGDDYPDKLTACGLEYARPTPAERAEIHRIIMNELVRGIFKSDSVAVVQRTMERLARDRCDAIVLGCTDHADRAFRADIQIVLRQVGTMIEGLAILDAEIAAMTISKGRQPLDRQRHVASSPHDDRHVDDRLGGEPRHRGAADVFNANC